jgi:hypothetical protein
VSPVSYQGGGSTAQEVREHPSGAIDGTNVVFALSQPQTSGSVRLFLNGLLLDELDDYIEGGSQVVLVDPPLPGDRLTALYLPA